MGEEEENVFEHTALEFHFYIFLFSFHTFISTVLSMFIHESVCAQPPPPTHRKIKYNSENLSYYITILVCYPAPLKQMARLITLLSVQTFLSTSLRFFKMQEREKDIQDQPSQSMIGVRKQTKINK